MDTLILLNFGGSIVGGAIVCVVAFRAGYRRGLKDGDIKGFYRGRNTTEKLHGVGRHKYDHLTRKRDQ